MNPEAQLYTQVVNELHKRWRPHPGQIKIGRSFFHDKCRWIFGELGRNWGKTELILYCFWRWAMFTPGSQNYYFGPTQELAHDIIWETKRLKEFGPHEWLAQVLEAEMKIVFTNGSYIKVDGSDNVGLNRGVKPKNGLIVYDEFKDFQPAFHNAFEPNIIPKQVVDGYGEDSNCSLMIFGTPPEQDGQFTEVAEEFKLNPAKKYFNGPSRENIYLKSDFLDNKKIELYRSGDGDVWEREYEAKRVRGGRRSIFPMLSKNHVKGHSELMFSLRRDLHKFVFYTITDPGTTSVFGSLFVAFNPFNRKVYFLDEVYETDPSKTTAKMQRPVIKEKENGIYEKTEWLRYADSAAQWFIQEIMGLEDPLDYSSVDKSALEKEKGIGFIKDMLLSSNIEISDRCIKLYWEMENYVKDKNGKIPKGNDHLIDCARYFFMAMGYQGIAESEPEAQADMGRKVHRLREEERFHDLMVDDEIG